MDSSRGLDAIGAVAGGTVAFDIETVPRCAIEALPVRAQRRVAAAVRREVRDDAAEEERRAVEERVLSTHPLLAQVVAIGFARAAPAARVALVSGAPPVAGGPALAERDLLVAFWQVAARAERLVGYHSRGFDVPVLLTRSAVHGVAASVDLLGARSAERHVDLYARLTQDGAFRHFGGLELACDTFGIPSPKAHTSGADVARLFRAGERERIGAYVLADVDATLALYERLRGTWVPPAAGASRGAKRRGDLLEPGQSRDRSRSGGSPDGGSA